MANIEVDANDVISAYREHVAELSDALVLQKAAAAKALREREAAIARGSALTAELIRVTEENAKIAQENAELRKPPEAGVQAPPPETPANRLDE